MQPLNKFDARIDKKNYCSDIYTAILDNGANNSNGSQIQKEVSTMEKEASKVTNNNDTRMITLE